MIKPFLKSLSFSFVTFATVALISALEQGRPVDRSDPRVEFLRPGCVSQSEIDRGWEEQQLLLEGRLAEKATDGLLVPGAIITPPFESYAPYRTDPPRILTAAKPGRTARRQSVGSDSRHRPRGPFGKL